MTPLRGNLGALGLLILSTWSCSAGAHVASNGFLVVRVTGQDIAGSAELAVRDIELAVGADANGDGRVTWGELRTAEPQVARYVEEHLAFFAHGSPCELVLQPIQVNDRTDGSYAWLPFTARCPAPVKDLDIRYTAMHDVDPSHRGLLTLTAGGVTRTGVLGSTEQSVFSVLEVSHWRSFVEYFAAGIRHILSGIDHLLFLLSLLLPAVLLRKDNRWEPVTRVRPAIARILEVVTAFTLAHSLTLTLAALNIVRLPSRLTESVIAASIVLAALNNIVPVVTESRARIAFAFGLLHGFGFASVLADMGLPQGARLTALLGFNLGIETGQLAVVFTVMPMIYGLRSGEFYRRTAMPWGSAAIAAMALVWLVQRAILPTG
ncbi:MAG: HupE/UreJ family protein [Gammaproteobacteria bacterium]|nr:HupE/UreJ family protein [Gammaproteobacteria bacterium]